MLLSFLGGTFGKFAIVGLVIAAAVGYHYFKLNNVQSQLTHAQEQVGVLKQDVATAQANEAQLHGAITSLNGTVERLEQQRRIDQQKIDKLSKQYTESRQKVSDLRQLLSEHDLAYLAYNKPGLIENRINAGTDRVGEDIQEITTYEEDSTD